MKHRDLNGAVIAAMLASGLYVTVTGVVADLFGLHQFAFHRYAGYLCAAFVFLHLILNGRRVVDYSRRLLGARQERGHAGKQKRSAGPIIGRRQVLGAALSAAGGFVLGWLVPDGRRELPGGASDIGDLYHHWSAPNHALDLPVPGWGERPQRYKIYPDAHRISLPDPRGFHELTVEEALDARRSVRDYADQPLSVEAVSSLLYAAQGITHRQREFRAAPSAGALYPLEIYPVVHSVTGLNPGVYHHAVEAHELERLRQGDFRAQVAQAGLQQRFLAQAGVCFLLSALFQRSRWKYHERAYRYILLEAGHIGQNLYLAATSLGLGACAVGAFYDDQLNRLLALNAEKEAVLYVISVGERA